MKLAAATALVTALAGCSDPKKAQAEAPADAYVDGGKLEEKPYDHVLGDPNAPVQIVEYASLQCHHCRDFAVGSAEHAAVFPLLKEKYIDTGKVRFVFRDYPLDTFATAATLAANCIAGTTGTDAPTPAQTDRFFAATHLIYTRLDYWYLNAGPGVVAMLRLPVILRTAGMRQSAFEACLQNQPLLTRVRDTYDEGSSKFAITSTPTFFINGAKHSGVIDFDKLEAILAPLLKNDTPAAASQ